MRLTLSSISRLELVMPGPRIFMPWLAAADARLVASCQMSPYAGMTPPR